MLACLAVLAVCGCGRKADATGDETSGTEGSSGAPVDLPGETETGDTDEPDPVEDCPAEPVLGELQAVFDGINVGFDYPYEADWDQPCTVVGHNGELLTGETITLACVDAEGQEVEHVLELRASVVDAEQPTSIPVTIGEPLRLTLWSRVWAGGASWILRSPDQPDDVRLIYYSTIELPTPNYDDFAPLPEFLSPLTLELRDDVCETICPEDNGGGGFVPPDCTCTREQALEFTLGRDSASIQHESAGAIGSSWYAFVGSAAEFPLFVDCSDVSESWYAFIVVKR